MAKSRVLTLILLLLTASLAGCTEEINEQVTVNEDGTCFAILEINGTMVSNGTSEGYDEQHASMETYTYNADCLVTAHLLSEGDYGMVWTNTTYNDAGQPLVIERTSSWSDWEHPDRYEHVYEDGLLVQLITTENLGSDYEHIFTDNFTYDEQGREISQEDHSGRITTTTYGSNGEVIQQVENSQWGTTISNMTYDAEGNQIQIVYASKYGDGDWSYYYDNFTYENGKLVQFVEDYGGPDYTYYTNYTYSNDGLSMEEWGPYGGVTITNFDADGNTLSEVLKSSQYEDGSWQYVFSKTYTWGDPLA